MYEVASNIGIHLFCIQSIVFTQEVGSNAVSCREAPEEEEEDGGSDGGSDSDSAEKLLYINISLRNLGFAFAAMPVWFMLTKLRLGGTWPNLTSWHYTILSAAFNGNCALTR